MYQYDQPDPSGHFGPYGGSFASETLTLRCENCAMPMPATKTIRSSSPNSTMSWRTSSVALAVYHAARTSREMGGAQIYLKREDLNHTGAHKINNVIGQAMLARRMGKTRASLPKPARASTAWPPPPSARATGSNAWSTWARDVKRQSPNVFRMKLLGATVVPVDRAARRSRMRSTRPCATGWPTWTTPSTSSAPWRAPPLPDDGARLQSVIGTECLAQMPHAGRAEIAAEQPDVVVACVAAGSNAMGIFHPTSVREDAPDRCRGRW